LIKKDRVKTPVKLKVEAGLYVYGRIQRLVYCTLYNIVKIGSLRLGHHSFYDMQETPSSVFYKMGNVSSGPCIGVSNCKSGITAAKYWAGLNRQEIIVAEKKIPNVFSLIAQKGMHSVNHETSAWRNSMLCLVT
jgi:hypothetical protein